ncbi:MAG: hypothetical protein K6F55_01400 [Eubacterium sp.]|nr:hypothetical protein [Eubacterium sp.]
MRRIKVFISLTLIILITFLYMGGNVSNAAEQFSVSVNSTVDKSGLAYIVNIDVTNNGKDFSGILRVYVNGASNQSGYDVDISVPAGGTKSYSVNIPIDSVYRTDGVTVLVYSKNMKRVFRESFRNVFTGVSNDILLGVLSDNPDKLSFLDLGGDLLDSSNQSSGIKIEKLDNKNIGDKLDQLTILVIDDYDTSTLPKETSDMITLWVESGGILMLGTGYNTDKAIKGLDSNMINAYIDGETMDYYGVSSKSVTMALVDFLDYPTVTNIDCMLRKDYNSGIILLSSLAISDIPEIVDDTRETFKALYNSVLLDSSSQGSDNSVMMSTYDIEEVQGYMEKPAKTGTWPLALIIITYVVLVGPILYLILKSLKIREKIWIFIPIVSLVFVAFIAVLSISLRVRGLNVKSVEIRDCGTGISNTYIMGYAAEPKDWSITTKQSYVCGNLLNSGYDTSVTGNTSGSLKDNKNNMKISFYPQTAFDTGVYRLQNLCDKNDRFVLEHDDFDRTNGYIINKTGMDFDFVFVCYNSEYELIENVEAGDKVGYSISQQKSFYNAGSLLSHEAIKYYNNKDYEKTSALAALALATASKNDNSNDVFAVGVVKGNSLTDQNENSWICYVSGQ